MAKKMKKTYHLCLSGKHEVMFRCEEDFIRGINCLCLAAIKTRSSLLAYTFMSNHVHICVRTDCMKKFMAAFWYPYNRYFNAKYGRSGRLGEKIFFQMEIVGLYHLLTCIAYEIQCITVSQELHSGISTHRFVLYFQRISVGKMICLTIFKVSMPTTIFLVTAVFQTVSG